jgi:hypothetical protein
MLLVCRLRLDGYGTALEFLHQRQQRFALPLGVAAIFLAQALPQQSPDADANQPIRQEISFQPPVRPRRHSWGRNAMGIRLGLEFKNLTGMHIGCLGNGGGRRSQKFGLATQPEALLPLLGEREGVRASVLDAFGINRRE